MSKLSCKIGSLKLTRVFVVSATIFCGFVVIVACGGSGTPNDSRAVTSAARTAAPISPTGTRPLRGDGDDDNDARTGETRSSKDDNDSDYDNDTREKFGFYDADDAAMVKWGKAAGPVDLLAISSVVKRYYAAAVAGDGSASCALLTILFAEAIPEDYGRGAGPSYARGSTCQVVSSKLFRHIHAQLARPIVVVAVRVQGKMARAMIGSQAAPAAVLPLRGEAGMWKVDSLLASTLP